MVTFECNANYLKRVECYTELKSWGETGSKKWGIPHGWIYILRHKGEIVYVGQTINPRGRLESHRSSKKQFDQVSLFHVYASKMNLVEGLLIVKYLPKYNLAIHSPVLGIGHNRDYLINFERTNTIRASRRYSGHRFDDHKGTWV